MGFGPTPAERSDSSALFSFAAGGNRRAFLYPEQIAQIDFQALKRGVDDLSLFRPEA
jgi:hypothetical protein